MHKKVCFGCCIGQGVPECREGERGRFVGSVGEKKMVPFLSYTTVTGNLKLRELGIPSNRIVLLVVSVPGYPSYWMWDARPICHGRTKPTNRIQTSDLNCNLSKRVPPYPGVTCQVEQGTLGIPTTVGTRVPRYPVLKRRVPGYSGAVQNPQTQSNRVPGYPGTRVP
eukprot:367580-Rhodomonas_salina.1